MQFRIMLSSIGALLLLAQQIWAYVADTGSDTPLDARSLAKRIVTQQNATLAGLACDGDKECIGRYN